MTIEDHQEQRHDISAREGTPIFQTQLHISLILFLQIILDNLLKPTPEYKHYMFFEVC